MKITIDGREYDIVMRGTVGLVILVERILGKDEPVDFAQNRYHRMLLCYALVNTCYPSISLERFTANLTAKMEVEMVEYINTRWIELEGVREAQDEDAFEGKKN